MSTPTVLQPDAVTDPLSADQLKILQRLNIEYSFRKKEVLVLSTVAAPVALYGFAGRKTWAKTVGVLGLVLAAVAYADLQRLDQERTAVRGTVLS